MTRHEFTASVVIASWLGCAIILLLAWLFHDFVAR